MAFTFDRKTHGKLKNTKVLRWRIELSQHDYEIAYRAGKCNVASDALSRAYCAIIHSDFLHRSLCHPGVSRMYHYVKTKNLPYSLEQVQKMTAACSTRAEIKPQFYKPVETHIVKATKPMERLCVDFKGPIASSGRNRYMLTIVDEFSRFSFAFPCANMDASTVIVCLSQLFTLFGLCAFVHSDRGPAFMSNDLLSYLRGKGIGVSKTSIYNQRGNGQCEKYNNTIWSGVKLALKDRQLPTSKWDTVLPDVLHSIRSLFCTRTNVTPHERFLGFDRRFMLGISTPSWLSCPGPVLLKRHVRSSTYDPYVDEVELIHAIPSYARVRMQSGREATMSLRDIAPVGEKRVDINETVDNANGVFDSETSVADTFITGDNVSNEDNVCDHDDNAVFRESSGSRRSSLNCL